MQIRATGLTEFLDATTYLYKRSCPSVRLSRVTFTTNTAVFEGRTRKSSNDIMINSTLSDDGVVASDELPRYLFNICFGLKL